MKIALGAIILASVPITADAPPNYEVGWNYVSVYKEVAACRLTIVASAAQSYVEKGISAHRSADDLRSEVISLLPAFDIPASNGCFCAVAEIAKIRAYSNYLGLESPAARSLRVAAQLGKPPCAERMGSAAALLREKTAIDAVRLK